jgi:hypothetical protein
MSRLLASATGPHLLARGGLDGRWALGPGLQPESLELAAFALEIEGGIDEILAVWQEELQEDVRRLFR